MSMEASPNDGTVMLMTLEGGEFAYVETVRRTFAIPEVLSAILSYCKKSDCAVSARVSKTWNPVALDWAWKDLVSLKPLLKLLGIVVKDRAGHLVFKQGLAAPNWNHFFSIARRVRSLIHDDRLHGVISSTLLVSLLSGFTSTGHRRILPNVRRITWNASEETMANHLTPFLSPTLKELSISLHGIRSDPTLSLLNSLTHSLSSRVIEVLDFESSDARNSARCRRALEALVNCLPRLQRLRVPDGLFGGSTKSLKHIAAGHHLIDLRILHLPTLQDSTEKVVSSLVNFFPQLEMLQLDIALEEEQPKPALTFDMLRPLLGLDLVELQITHPNPMILVPENIQAMGKAWRSMQLLHLCANPAFGHPAPEGTPIGHLRYFASYFSTNLERLAHYFCTSHTIPPGNRVFRSFPSLEVLGVGTTVFEPEDAWPLGVYFAALCPKKVEIAYADAGPDWDRSAFERVHAEEWDMDWGFMLQAMKTAHLSQEGAIQRYLSSLKSIEA